MVWKFFSVSASVSPAGEMSASWKQKNGRSSTRKSSKAALAFTLACAMGSPGPVHGREIVGPPKGSLPVIVSECQ